MRIMKQNNVAYFSKNNKVHKRSTSKTEMLNPNNELKDSIITLYSKVELNYIFMENGIPTEEHRQSIAYVL